MEDKYHKSPMNVTDLTGTAQIIGEFCGVELETMPISWQHNFLSFSELWKHCLSHSYLTGVIAALLRQHLSNMNMI